MPLLLLVELVVVEVAVAVAVVANILMSRKYNFLDNNHHYNRYILVDNMFHYNSLMTIHNKYLHSTFQYYLDNKQYLDMFHRKNLLYQDSIRVDYLDILRGSQFHMGLVVMVVEA